MAVTVTLSETELSVRFTGLDAVWALTGGIKIPLTEVTGARIVQAADAKTRLRWRTAGTSIPKVVNAGRFTVSDEPGARELWSTYRDDEYLEITTTRQRPHRIVVQHQDRATLAERINAQTRGA